MISLHNMLPFELTKDTPYLALSGELWSVFYEYFNRNWPCYKEFLLYRLCQIKLSARVKRDRNRSDTDSNSPFLTQFYPCMFAKHILIESLASGDVGKFLYISNSYHVTD